MCGLGYRVSGSGSWQSRRRRKSGSRLALGVLFFLLTTAWVACSSQPEPAQPQDAPPGTIVAPTQAPLAANSNAATPPAPSDGAPAAPSKTGASTGAVLGALPSLAGLIESINPAVASVSIESVASGLFFDFTNEGAGSGIVVRPDGYVVTNFHVVQDALDVKVTLRNGRTYAARVVGRDVLTDLAVLKIDADNLPTVTFGDSEALKPGDWVVTLGNALALKGGPTVTLGIVSAVGRTVNTDRGALYDMIQTDAAINEGNSGGPLVNLKGEVIGINTVILREAQGIGFAISSAVANPIIDSLIKHGRVVRPLIGLTGVDVTPARASQLNLNVSEGIIVTSLSRNGPTYRAGIRVGDVITKMNEIPTRDMAEFLTLLWTFKVGDVVRVEYIVNGQTRVVPIELAERVTD